LSLPTSFTRLAPSFFVATATKKRLAWDAKNIGNDKGKRWGEHGWRIELWNIAKWLAENSAYAGRLFISNAGIAAPAAR
jgi:hypothetical protein